MKANRFVKIIITLLILVAAIKAAAVFFIEPWIKSKIETALNKDRTVYTVELADVDILFLSCGIELERVNLKGGLDAEIRSVKLTGIDLLSLRNNDVNIRKVIISNGNIRKTRPATKENKSPALSPANIKLGELVVKNMRVTLGDPASAREFKVEEGELRISDISIAAQDTLSLSIIRKFDLEAKKISSVSRDSLYTFSIKGISYSGESELLSISNFSIVPSYKGYEFTSRHRYETDCFEASFSDISAYDLAAADYFLSGNFKTSFISIGEMEISAFRDKRKEFKHVERKTFQQIIYDFPGKLRIDTIAVMKGKVTYTEHAEGANEAGSISFTDMNAKIYNVTNDTALEKSKGYLILQSDALLMGKGKINVLLKSKLFDAQHTFTLTGHLSAMNAEELNPIVEKNGFVFITSGKINSMNFDFTANDNEANGKLTMLYNGLDLTLKNKQTDDTTAFKERFTSLVVNKLVLNANPQPGQEVRVGTIDYVRDPEKFLFNYCVKSIVSGLKTSVVKVGKNHEKKVNRKQEKEAEKKTVRSGKKKK